jgi:hypothetical protein|tara:strand:- start:117 stop:749 length:633 start_codon:yes stop_codon:yes gene_type:complete
MTIEKPQSSFVLVSLEFAVDANEKLNKVSEAPKAEHSGFMMDAILAFAELSKNEAKACRAMLKIKGIPTGTVNAVSLFTVGNPAHKRLSSLLENFTLDPSWVSKSGDPAEQVSLDSEAKKEYLEAKEITSYNKLKKYCVVVSDDVQDLKTAKALANLNAKRYNKVLKLAEKFRLENEAKIQADKNKLNGKKLVSVTKEISTKAKDKAANK